MPRRGPRRARAVLACSSRILLFGVVLVGAWLHDEPQRVRRALARSRPGRAGRRDGDHGRGSGDRHRQPHGCSRAGTRAGLDTTTAPARCGRHCGRRRAPGPTPVTVADPWHRAGRAGRPDRWSQAPLGTPVAPPCTVAPCDRAGRTGRPRPSPPLAPRVAAPVVAAAGNRHRTAHPGGRADHRPGRPRPRSGCRAPLEPSHPSSKRLLRSPRSWPRSCRSSPARAGRRAVAPGNCSSRSAARRGSPPAPDGAPVDPDSGAGRRRARVSRAGRSRRQPGRRSEPGSGRASADHCRRASPRRAAPSSPIRRCPAPSSR